MLRFRDALTLAVAKLRVRRLRLGIMLITCGLLLATLITSSLLIRGTQRALQTLNGNGLTTRFIVATRPNVGLDILQDPAHIARALQIQTALLSQEAAEAKRLGVPFDPSSAPQPIIQINNPDGQHQILDLSQPAALQTISEMDNAAGYYLKLQDQLQGHQPQAIYEGNRIVPDGGRHQLELAPIINGAEIKPTPGTYGLTSNSLASFQTGLITLDNSLLRPFVLNGLSLDAAPGEPVPILAPTDAAEKLLGLTPLPPSAPTSAKITRLQTLRQRIRDYQFDVCYRNQAALDIQRQIQQPAQTTSQTNVPQPPSITYTNPAGPCLPAVIKADTRTPADQAAAAKLQQFQQEFGAQSPITTRVTFRVVGLVPQLNSNFLTPSLGYGWFASNQAALQHPVLGALIDNPLAQATGAKQYYIEFPNRAAQQQFLDQRGSSLNLISYGNPLATFASLQPNLIQGLRAAIIAIAVLCAFIISSAIQKTITDSRPETSLLRAIGAKRLHIVQIYLLYTTVIVTLAFAAAFIISLSFSLWLQSAAGSTLTFHTLLAFNSLDTTPTFHIVALAPLDYLSIYALTLATALAGTILPLFTNLRRSPLQDLPEE